MSHFKSTIINNKVYSFVQDKKIGTLASISNLKSGIENDIRSKGLFFRIGTIQDIEKITLFQKTIFFPHTATLESEYELFRIIKFGYALLIENDVKEILGCYTTIHYAGKEKEGYGIRVSISPKIEGYNFAAKLAKYAVTLAFENGCKNFNALMSPVNFKSASNVLNHVGYYCKRFYRNLPSFGARFEISLPLTLETLNNAEVDIEKIVHFVRTQELNEDYLLIEPNDIDRIEDVYSSTDFRIIAFLRKGIIDEKDYFFAVKPIKSNNL